MLFRITSLSLLLEDPVHHPLGSGGIRHCPDRASRHREVLLDLEHYEELAVDQTDETLDKPASLHA